MDNFETMGKKSAGSALFQRDSSQPRNPELAKYYKTLYEKIVAPLGFYCLPFSEEQLEQEKNNYVLHKLVQQLMNDGNYSTDSLALATGIKPDLIRRIYTNAHHHVILEPDLRDKIILIHQATFGNVVNQE